MDAYGPQPSGSTLFHRIGLWVVLIFAGLFLFSLGAGNATWLVRLATGVDFAASINASDLSTDELAYARDLKDKALDAYQRERRRRLATPTPRAVEPPARDSRPGRLAPRQEQQIGDRWFGRSPDCQQVEVNGRLKWNCGHGGRYN